MVGHRLRSVYTRASGFRRQGPLIAMALEGALAAALHDGRLVMENPLNAAGHADHTFRLPDQPRVRPRMLGERTLDEVPADELALLLRAARSSYPASTENERFRVVLARLGRKALTAAAVERLAIVSRALLEPSSGDLESPGGRGAGAARSPAATGPEAYSPADSRPDDLLARDLAAFGPVIEGYLADRGRITRSEAAQICVLEPERASLLLRALVGAGRLDMRGARRGAYYVQAGAADAPETTRDSDPV